MSAHTAKGESRYPAFPDAETIYIELVYLASDLNAINPDAAMLVKLAADEVYAGLERPANGLSRLRELASGNGKSHLFPGRTPVA